MQVIDNINHLLGDPSTSEHVAAVKFCAHNGTPRTITEIHVSAAIASATEAKAAYIKTRALDDHFYQKLVTEYLQKFGKASRAELNDLLRDKLSNSLDDEQKINKINNLITNMRRARQIRNTGPRKTPYWVLIEPDAG